MSRSTKLPTTLQLTQKKRSHQCSATQEMGFLKDKNGDPVTISIFDIFTNNKSSKDGAKGRKMSLLKDKAKVQASAAVVSTKAEASEAPKATDDASTHGAATTFTAIEDVALKAMKADGKTWKEISELFIGKELDAIQAHYKELSHDAAADTNDEEGKAKGAEEAKDDMKEDQKVGKKGKGKGKGKDTGEQTSEEKGKASQTGVEQVTTESRTSTNETSTNGTSSSRTFSNGVPKKTGEKIVLGPIIDMRTDEELNAEEITHLLSFIPRYEKHMWLAVASRYFDKTSKRVDYLELAKVVKDA
ncbi:hypothetical protein ABVK25_010056 [Lepraria finkii]|uniref:Myb-like domain-containing protein n=1 Tax=Lepraria finkii TaxID=1340010 RepID=A0ABR4AVL9_9LECA